MPPKKGVRKMAARKVRYNGVVRKRQIYKNTENGRQFFQVRNPKTGKMRRVYIAASKKNRPAYRGNMKPRPGCTKRIRADCGKARGCGWKTGKGCRRQGTVRIGKSYAGGAYRIIYQSAAGNRFYKKVGKNGKKYNVYVTGGKVSGRRVTSSRRKAPPGALARTRVINGVKRKIYTGPKGGKYYKRTVKGKVRRYYVK